MSRQALDLEVGHGNQFVAVLDEGHVCIANRNAFPDEACRHRVQQRVLGATILNHHIGGVDGIRGNGYPTHRKLLSGIKKLLKWTKKT